MSDPRCADAYDLKALLSLVSVAEIGCTDSDGSALMKTLKILIAAMFASSAAHAATLQDVRGDVLVSHGSGFVAANPGAELAPGDRIKVGRKGGARLVYSDGCSVPVSAGGLSMVSKQSPCSFKAQAGGETFCTDANLFENPCFLIGALGVAGVAGAAAAVASSYNSNSTFFGVGVGASR